MKNAERNAIERGEKRDRKVREAMELLDAGVEEILEGEAFKRYLAFAAKFHRYSSNNALLILVQRPNATRVAGGVDLIIIYNSGRYRMAGRGSLAGLLPYGDANAIVVEMASEVLPVVEDTPVLAGVCGTDPFRLMPIFLRQLKEMGFSGVQNFPTVGLFDGTFRRNLEETGMGFDLEVEMIRQAHELDLLTAPYVFDEEEARKMAEAGADVLVPHMGLTTSGTIGAKTALTLDDSVERVQAMRDAAREANPDVLVLCHSGPIASPDDARYVLERTNGGAGFFGASSMERLPTEVAMTENTRRFKEIGTEV